MCGWTYDLHPLDAEGVDVGRCPTEDEQQTLWGYYVSHMGSLKALAYSFPRAKLRAYDPLILPRIP
jgi:hypothetical protein